MKNKTRGLRRSILILMLALFLALPALADAVDLNATGSISLTLRDSATRQPIPGGQMCLYRVADIREDLSGYVLTPAFEGSGQSLDDISSPALAGALARYAANGGIAGAVASPGADGTVRFDGLAVGLYLMTQTEAAAGYEAFSPFAVSVPFKTPDGAYEYDVDASPKPGSPLAVPTPTPVPPPPPPGENIPQTGQLWWPVVALAAAGCVLLIAGWMRRRRSDRRE
jgi:hypothetical protein